MPCRRLIECGGSYHGGQIDDVVDTGGVGGGKLGDQGGVGADVDGRQVDDAVDTGGLGVGGQGGQRQDQAHRGGQRLGVHGVLRCCVAVVW